MLAEGFVLDPTGHPSLDLGASLSGPPVTNLVPNPNPGAYDQIGAVPAGWTQAINFNNPGAALSAQTVAGGPSPTALRVVTTAVASEGGEIALPGMFLSGVTYVASAWMKGNAGGEVVLLGVGTGADVATVGVTLGTGWQRVTVPWTPGGNRTGVSLVSSHGAATVVSWFVTAVMVTQSAAVTNYGDGDFAGWLWSGTPGNSISIGGLLRLAALVIPPARRLPQWVTNGDSDGSQLVRPPFYGPRDKCSLQVRVNATTMDQAMTAIGALERKLQEAAIRGAGGGDGLPFLWTPSGASVGLTGYMLLVEITDMPITVDDAWFAHCPLLTVAFTCKPFLYGEETSIAAVTSTAPVLTLTVPDVPGDVAAEARLVVTDLSSQDRRHVEGGLECVHYDAVSPAPLVIDSTALVTSGFAGSGTALSGAYGGSAIASTLLGQPVAVCGTGSQPHVGTFRVKARVWATSTAEYWRLSWQEGDGSFAANDYAQPVAGSAFNELDLGVVTIDEAEAGVQSWSGRVEAFTTTPDGELAEVDYLSLFPALEGYWLLNADSSDLAGVVTAYDGFTTLAAGTALNGHAAAIGGTWATSGGTTGDFLGGALNGGPNAGRAASTGTERFAILGASTPTNVEVGVSVAVSSMPPSSASPAASVVIARWTDANNYLYLGLEQAVNFASLQLVYLVGSVVTILGEIRIPSALVAGAFSKLRLVAYASGLAVGAVFDAGGAQLGVLTGFGSALATGGGLANGKSGIGDASAAAVTRYYDEFYTALPPAEPLVIHSGKSLEIRSESNQRQSADGTTYADIPSRGSRLFVPPAGDAGRTTRIAVRATRNDPTVVADTPLGDNLQAQVLYRPRYLVVPRS